MIGLVLTWMKTFARNKISCLLKSVPLPFGEFFNDDGILEGGDFKAP